MLVSPSRRRRAALPTLALLFALGPLQPAHAGLMLQPIKADEGDAVVEPPVSHFDRVLLDAAWRDLLDISLTGLLDGQRVYQHTIRLNHRGAVMFDFQE